MYVALLDVTNIWRLLCALWQGGGAHASIIQHTAFCTQSHIAHHNIYQQKAKITMQTLNVLLCSFFGLVDCLKDQMDETAEVLYYLSNGSENQLLKLSRTLVHKEKSQRYLAADLAVGKIKMTNMFRESIR